MEKDIIFLGTDGRFRILGYEPTQLNVIRVADLSNRIQTDLDALDKSDIENFFAVFFEQKYILCNGASSFPYDRRYLGFLGEWTNQTFSSMIIWDKGTKQQKLFAAGKTDGKIYQILVDDTYDDAGDNTDASLRVKRIDAGEDTIIKFFNVSTFKFKNPRGLVSISTYKDGESFVDTVPVTFISSGGIGEGMFDEFMFDEGVSISSSSTTDSVRLIDKELYFEAYSIYHTISVVGNSENHVLVQSMNGYYEFEDPDYQRDELII